MPGSTTTAGRFSAGTPALSGPRERAIAVAARVPLASCPAHDSGPIRRKSAGCSSISPLATALTLRSLAK